MTILYTRGFVLFCSILLIPCHSEYLVRLIANLGLLLNII